VMLTAQPPRTNLALMLPQWIIEKKRDGGELSNEEIRSFVGGYSRGEIPDYQMAALAMAIYFRGMTGAEVGFFTGAMMRSGGVVDTSGIDTPTVDKHSTGGVGDKVSLILAPLAACCGVAVPMISGRGLGITGGTLDKLESIRGYRTDLSIDEFLEVIRECGCSIIGQTSDLAPADKKLYALRDVTGTVPSIPLISASIMSKKLAEGAAGLVLDVKYGRGAFMKTREEARDLAQTMVEIGRRAGRGMRALITDMNQPLGRAAGNAVEVTEVIETLRGNGPPDLVELTLELTAHMLMLGGTAAGRDAALPRLRACLESGEALDRFRRMVELHGGDTRVVDDPTQLPAATRARNVLSPGDGYVSAVDAGLIGRACLVLGAGRTRTEDGVDHAAGITGLVKVGERMRRGEVLAALHSNRVEAIAEAEALTAQAFSFAEDKPARAPLIAEVIS